MGLNRSKIQTGLAQTPQGVPQELFLTFFQVYTAIHNLEAFLSQYAGVDEQDQQFWPQLSPLDTILSGNMNRWYVKQFEPLAFGNCVAVLLDAGEMKVRKANATNNSKFAIGFVSSFDHIVGAGNFCEVTLGLGLVAGVVGMIPGIRYFLSTSDGLITNVQPVAAGNIEQAVGISIGTDKLFMNVSGSWIQH